MATTSTARTERPRFYEQQYLGAADLTSVVEYGRMARARHDLGAHVWGIAAGLQLVEKDSLCGGPREMYVQPGYAWDGYGRAITVLAPIRLLPSAFEDIVFDSMIDAGSPAGRLVRVWIRYRESAVGGPPPGFEICSGDDQYSRTWETYQIVIGKKVTHADRHDTVHVHSYDVDAREVPKALGIPGDPPLEDESVAFQTLPEDDDGAKWLVPLGVVRWLPPNGAAPGGFEQRVESTDPDPTVGPRDFSAHERARRYIGVVAGTVNAAGPHIRMRHRDRAFDPAVWSDDLVWVDGSARIAGDATLLNGRIVFRDAAYDDHHAPLTIARVEANALGGRDLRLQIGAGETGVNRLVVGPMLTNPAGTATTREKLVVKDNAMVGIGEPNPDRPLVVRSQGTNEDALGLQTAAGATRWALALKAGGVVGLHVRETVPDVTRVFIKEGGDVGIGTTAPTQNLHVQGNRGIRQNELYLSGGDGNRWSSIAFNAHHNAANNAWVFPNPGRRALTVEMDDSGGDPRFEVWSTTTAATMSFTRRFAINGEAGTTLIAPNGGDVGIGTNSPANRLDVEGGTGLRVNRMHLSGGGGGSEGSSLTYNAFRNAANSAWVFPDNSRHAVTVEMDDYDGSPRFEVWSTTSGNKTSFRKRFRIDGESGDVTMATQNGFVGIGLTNPISRLHVAHALSGAASDIDRHVAIIDNTATDDNADVLALRIGRSRAESSNNFITFFADGNDIGAIEGDGQILFNGIQFTSGSADFAEWMPRVADEEPLAAGDVVGVHGGFVSRRTDGADQLMVVSTAPIVLANRPPENQRERFEKIAFVGSTPVKVRGDVLLGDFLLASEQGDGTAVAARPEDVTVDDLPRVVGIAWGQAEGEGAHLVRAAIGMPAGRRVLELIATEVGRGRGSKSKR